MISTRGHCSRRQTAVTLLVLDGLGLSSDSEGNAVRAAATPTLCELWENYPRSTLRASGRAVGLVPGQMGNSNVGHLHLGAGRIIFGEAVRIDRAIREKKLGCNAVLRDLMDRTCDRGSTLHLMGLLSDGLVHSSLQHLLALLSMARERGVRRVALHAFLDGRDVPPRSAEEYLRTVEDDLSVTDDYRVATMGGRYWAMDRDERWDRVDPALAAILRGEGRVAEDVFAGLEAARARGEDDEFVTPTVVGDYAGWTSGDTFLFCNFRADRARQLTRALLEPGDVDCDCRPLDGPADLVTMTQYDVRFDCPVAFGPPEVGETLGEVISSAGLSQLRLAETEKYAHVTYFLNGGREDPFAGEERVMIPSPAVATYDQCPAMSAEKVTHRLEAAITSEHYDFIAANLANLDMVGHTGVFSAAVQAAEAVDACLYRVVQASLQMERPLLVVSDHGNAEKMTNGTEPHTAHTANDVPAILVGQDNLFALREEGGLTDVAPTVLDLMGLPVPEEMTGHSLLREGDR